MSHRRSNAASDPGHGVRAMRCCVAAFLSAAIFFPPDVSAFYDLSKRAPAPAPVDEGASASERAGVSIRSDGLAAQLAPRVYDDMAESIDREVGVRIGVPLAAALGRQPDGKPRTLTIEPVSFKGDDRAAAPDSLSSYTVSAQSGEAAGVVRFGPADRPFLAGLDLRKIAEDDARMAIEVEANDLVWANAGGAGFDVTFAPRASIRRDGLRTAARAGAEVRVGPALTAGRAEAGKAPTWYVYAGADGEAVMMDVARVAGLAGGVAFDNIRREDTLVAGDIVAGVAMRRDDLHYGFAYMRREYSYKDFNTEEDYIGVTATKTW